MASNANPCIKIFMIIINVLFLLCGAAILGIGVWITQQDNQLNKFLGIELGFDLQRKLAYLAIGVGVFTMLISLIGCFGAIKESQCFLILFVIVQVLVLILLVVCIALAFVYRGQIYSLSKEKMQWSITNNYNESSEAFFAWRFIEKTFNCCAVETGQAVIYQGSPWYRQQTQKSLDTRRVQIPDSCCKPNQIDCVYKDPVPSSNPGMNSEGCWNAMTRLTEKYTLPSLIVVFGSAAFMLLGIIMTVIFICQVSRNKNTA